MLLYWRLYSLPQNRVLFNDALEGNTFFIVVNEGRFPLQLPIHDLKVPDDVICNHFDHFD